MKEEYHMALTAWGKRICVILASIGSGKTFCPVGPLTKAHSVLINFRLSQKFQKKISKIYGGKLKSKNYSKLFLIFSITFGQFLEAYNSVEFLTFILWSLVDDLKWLGAWKDLVCKHHRKCGCIVQVMDVY